MNPLRLGVLRFFFASLILVPIAGSAQENASLVRLTFRPDTPNGARGAQRTAEGKILVEGQDGSMAFLDRGGRIWLIGSGGVAERKETDEAFSPFTQEEMVEELKEELGENFEIVTTRHYILCSEANREYARWTGSLFERLMGAFMLFYSRDRELELHPPEFPLCAIILKNEQSFKKFALADAGPKVLDAQGYFSSLTNRMVMYDLTAGLGGSRPTNILELNRRLAGQIGNVSTIVHEATHQIAFNSGMHVRLASNPLWLVEGMAMFFETPDLKSSSGWRRVGGENDSRLRRFQEYARTRRQPGSSKAMLLSDERYQMGNREALLDAYAEAWAFSYYLIKRKRAQYVEYLKTLQNKPPFEQDTPEQRLADFEEAFGELDAVERGFIEFFSGLQSRRGR